MLDVGREGRLLGESDGGGKGERMWLLPGGSGIAGLLLALEEQLSTGVVSGDSECWPSGLLKTSMIGREEVDAFVVFRNSRIRSARSWRSSTVRPRADRTSVIVLGFALSSAVVAAVSRPAVDVAMSW